MKNFNMADDYHTSQSNLMAAARLQQQQPQVVDEMSQDLHYLSREAPLDGGESTFGVYSQLGGGSQHEESVLHMGSDLDEDERRRLESPMPAGYASNEQALNQLSPDNVDIQRPLQQAGSPIGEQQPEHRGQPGEQSTLPLKPFLVSFMVDARGGAMRGCRHSGVRVIIPPNSAQMPTRITCRYLRRERLVHPPPLMEGEACASKIMEVGPAGAKFLGPVLIEVPHFASLRGKEREIIILRSDNGEVWREHLVEPDERLIDSIIRSAADTEELRAQSPDQENQQPPGMSGDGGGGYDADAKRRLTRIVTTEFPQYFAIISRIRQEVHAVGPEGSTVNSQVVPRVQAIFTEGALTKRIKIGLQPKGNKQQSSEQDSHRTLTSDPLQSSASNQQATIAEQENGEHLDSLSLQERAVSPGETASQTTGDKQSHHLRPNSAAAKRRSRFLACFGGHGSVDLLDNDTGAGTGTDGGESSSAGGDSPRQPAAEKPFKSRHILGDVSDSESVSSLGGGVGGERTIRSKRLANAVELVPEDYYIEQEPPLILNVEPKTYGKRLASSSAQTESKPNGYLSTSAKTKKRHGGLLRGKRKNKTQLTIHCDAPSKTTRTKSTEPVDSSLDTVNGTDGAPGQQQSKVEPDEISLIQDVITSDDQKWRTCTIQTDSDSVTVNYVTIAGNSNGAAVGVTAIGAAASGQDDGYISGSGDLNKQPKGGLFGFPCAGKAALESDEQSLDGGVSSTAEPSNKQPRKDKAKTTGKLAKKTRAAESASKRNTDTETISEKALTSSGESPEPKGDESQSDDQAGASLSITETTTRSVSPTSKELKLKQKLEKQERIKREKEEKRIQKELEEAAAKAEKTKKRLEKEAKKAEKEAEKEAKKLAKKVSPPASPAPQAGEEATLQGKQQASSSSKGTSVKFAPTLVETNSPSEHSSSFPSSPSLESQPVQQQLDSIQQVVERTSENYEREKERLSQEDGRDMVRVSISERIEHQPDGSENVIATRETLVLKPGTPELRQEDADDQSSRLISFSDSEEPSKSLELTAGAPSGEQQADAGTTTVTTVTTTTNLRPILKQQSTVSSGEEAVAELVIGHRETEDRATDLVATKLVGAATDEAIKASTGELTRSTQGAPISEPTLSSASKILSDKELAKLVKEEKAREKREAKERLKAEKRLAKEAKEAKRLAEAEAKKVAKAAKLEADRLAKEAKAESYRLAKETERQAKAAKAQAQQLAKEEEKRLQMELKLAKKAKGAKEGVKLSASQVEDSSASLSEPAKLISSQSVEAATTTSKRRQSEEEETVSTAGAAPISDETIAKEQSSLEVPAAAVELELELLKEVEEADDVVKPAKVEPDAGRKVPAGDETVVVVDVPKTTASPSDEHSPDKASGKEGKKKKPKQEATGTKKVKREGEKVSESSELASSSKSQNFLGRLFSRKAGKSSKQNAKVEIGAPLEAAAATTRLVATTATGDAGDQVLQRREEKPVILSEMYPSDPDDVDGEMILEVNVPKNLIEKRELRVETSSMQPIGADFSQASTVASPTLGATTIDESLVTTDDHQGQQQQPGTPKDIVKPPTAGELDLEATLVNMSQTIASETAVDDDEEATENIASQANDDLTTEAVNQSAGVVAPQESPSAKGEPATAATDTLVIEDKPGEGVEPKKLSAAELKEEKARKELEVKLEKEAKKREKEEKERAKRLARDEAERAKVEAKRRAKEDKERAKREAKEAKRLAKLAKEQAKKDKKNKKVDEATASALAAAQEAAGATRAPQAGQPAEAPTNSGDDIDTSNMTPVNTETEVRQIVEEVVGDDGVVTKTTKTIETKYVTMRQEEIVSERRDLPVEEYERIRAEERQRSGSVDLSSASSSKAEEDGSSRKVKKRSAGAGVSSSPLTGIEKSQEPSMAEGRRVVRIEVGPYEHAELDAIRATPSYFETDREVLDIPGDASPKRELKKRVKLNNKLIKRAFKLASKEKHRAKKEARAAESEIANCDEAAKRAQKALKRALKEAKRARKEATKQHKKMDQIDKKLAKRQRKIEKKQKKLDKRAEKLAQKEAKRREKLAKREAKLERQESQKSGTSSGSKRSIKLADIGAPVLRSSSRDLAPVGVALSPGEHERQQQEMVSQTSKTVMIERAGDSPSNQVEMSLDPATMPQPPGEEPEMTLVSHTITTTTRTELPDGRVDEQVSERVLNGEDAIERLEMAGNGADQDDEEIDVVSELPNIEQRAAKGREEAAAEMAD